MSEFIPGKTLADFLDDNWKEGNVVKPNIIEINAPPDSFIRADLRTGDVLMVKTDVSGRAESWRGNWAFKDIADTLSIELQTKDSRQRLYDLVAEVKRICEAGMHNIDDYQAVRFLSFAEANAEEYNIWRLTAKILLQSVGIRTAKNE